MQYGLRGRIILNKTAEKCGGALSLAVGGIL
jgi:hypothetical protein